MTINGRIYVLSGSTRKKYTYILLSTKLPQYYMTWQ